MSRFTERLRRADQKVDRYFAEASPVKLFIGGVVRPVVAIFESPDAPVSSPGGGEINDTAPALSTYTADISGLSKRDRVVVGDEVYWVTHIGADEAGRTRITLANGEPGEPAPVINGWSK